MCADSDPSPTNLKQFYDQHSNFANRRLTEYNISPGIKCKFDTIKARLGNRKFNLALDVGCSGNSFIHFLPSVTHRTLCDLAHSPLIQYNQYPHHHPLCGSITQLPFTDNCFDLVVGLDVLEHIPNDEAASQELVRVLAPKGLCVITVPHRMAFFTPQDTICGHVRRYEYPQIQKLFQDKGLRQLMMFPVYGQFMRAQYVQEANPQKTEESLNNLRNRYSNDLTFAKFWDQIVKIGAQCMKWDAKFQPFLQTMDICLIFRKPNKK